MQDVIDCIHSLSSRRVAERKKAIQRIRRHMCGSRGHMVRLALQYVARHDPNYTVRNIARQAFYMEGMEHEEHQWERAFSF